MVNIIRPLLGPDELLDGRDYAGMWHYDGTAISMPDVPRPGRQLTIPDFFPRVARDEVA